MTENKRQRGRKPDPQLADLVNFLVYVPPRTKEILDDIWSPLGYASRAEMCRQLLREFADNNESVGKAG